MSVKGREKGRGSEGVNAHLAFLFAVIADALLLLIFLIFCKRFVSSSL